MWIAYHAILGRQRALELQKVAQQEADFRKSQLDLMHRNQLLELSGIELHALALGWGYPMQSNIGIQQSAAQTWNEYLRRHNIPPTLQNIKMQTATEKTDWIKRSDSKPAMSDYPIWTYQQIGVTPSEYKTCRREFPDGKVFSHWKKAEPHPEPPPREATQTEKDRTAGEAGWKKFPYTCTYDAKIHWEGGFSSGLLHARQELKELLDLENYDTCRGTIGKLKKYLAGCGV